jgi:hypothetical protein
MDTGTVMIAIGAAAWVTGYGLGWYVRGKVEVDGRKMAELLREETREAPTVEEAKVDRFITLYATGYSLDQVGRITGNSPTYVRNRLLEAGVKMRKQGRPSIKRKTKNYKQA